LSIGTEAIILCNGSYSDLKGKQLLVNKPIKILQVVGGMDRGGVETWLMHVLRNLNPQQFNIDFLVHTLEPCAYDNEIRTLGSNIIPCMHPSHPLEYAYNFKKIVKEYGPYDVIHSHVHHYSGFILKLAYNLGIPKRIAHSHSAILNDCNVLRRIYYYYMEYLINRYSTSCIACSSEAAISLFGQDWNNHSLCKLLYCGINIDNFLINHNICDIYKELNIPNNAWIIGHVGRFNKPKNHLFLIDIFKEILIKEPNAYLLLIGDGPLHEIVYNKVLELKLDKNVVFTGIRTDVSRLLNAVDLFVMPSLHEGLPLALIEAQVAGIPCLISDTITSEIAIVKPLIHNLSLNESPLVWADAALSNKNNKGSISRQEALKIVAESKFNICNNIGDLIALYSDNCIS
jgi:glycosyltransferase involved in cell wall biosynthesis